MADRKITDLTALAAGSQATGDLLTIVDVSEAAATDKNKKITVESLFKGIPSNVGIGTSLPGFALEVNSGTSDSVALFKSSDATARIILRDNGSTSGGYVGVATEDMFFHTNGNERMRINSSGNVGIGTAAPGGQLDVSGTSDTRVITRESGNSVRTDLMSQTSQGGVGTTSNHPFFIQTNGSEKARIDTNGTLLVGATSAISAGNSQYAKIQTFGNTAGATNDARVVIGRGQASTAMSNNTSIGEINFTDNAGGEFAQIQAAADAAPGANDFPGRLVFKTCADSSSNLTERMRIDSSGNVNIGSNISSNPFTYLRFGASQHGAADIRPTNEGSHKVGLAFYTDGTQDTTINPTERMRLDTEGHLQIRREGVASMPGVDTRHTRYVVRQTNGQEAILGSVYAQGKSAWGGELVFASKNANSNPSTGLTERMRIDKSGTVCIGRTTSVVGTNKLSIEGDGSSTIVGVQTGTTSAIVNFAQFLDGSGTSCGGIAVNATTNTTSYITTSDHRLKENIVDIAGAIARLNNLAPKRFNFIDDTTQTTLDGFIAHEVQSVVPEAVVGDHNEVDDDNNPVYQGIDQSKLVPLLTAALQEAIAEIETLKTKVAALEAG